jgi:hypothetical protein
MYIVKINDGYCEWTYEFEGGGRFCIQDIADAISRLGLDQVDNFLSSPYPLDSDPEATVNKKE